MVFSLLVRINGLLQMYIHRGRKNEVPTRIINLSKAFEGELFKDNLYEWMLWNITLWPELKLEEGVCKIWNARDVSLVDLIESVISRTRQVDNKDL